MRAFLFALGEPLGFDESFVGRRFLQDKFIASLDLPTYHNFEYYQFLDVLDALSFRLMVIDHINKIEDEMEENDGDGAPAGFDPDALNENLDEKDIKDKIEKEVNQLIF